MKTKRLSFNLNLVELASTGFWFCLKCQHITEPEHDQHDMPHCVLCSSPRIRFNPPVFDSKPPQKMSVEPYRQKLDAACNACQTALRCAVEQPSQTTLENLSRAIAQANACLTDLTELEEALANQTLQTA